MQLSHADISIFSSPASWNCDTTRVWGFSGPWWAAGALLDWTLASSTLAASRLRSRGTCDYWGVSVHVSWTFNETWWNLSTYLETHAGSFTVPSQYNKAQEFVSCCEEKSGIMLHINNFRVPSKCKKIICYLDLSIPWMNKMYQFFV